MIYNLDDLRSMYTSLPKADLLEDGSDALKTHIQAWVYRISAGIMYHPNQNRFMRDLAENPENVACKLFDLIMAE